MTIELPNHNNETLAAKLLEYMERLEDIEAILAQIPGIDEYAGAALGITEGAEGVVKAVTGAEAPKPAPAPVPVPVPAPAAVTSSKPSLRELLKQAQAAA